MANSARLRRIAEQIQRDLSELIRLEVKDPRIGFVTLTGVDVTADLAHAKIWFTTLGSGAEHEQTGEGLNRAAGFLRSSLAHRIKTRTMPELHFVFDASVERGMHLSQLIDKAVADSSGGE